MNLRAANGLILVWAMLIMIVQMNYLVLQVLDVDVMIYHERICFHVEIAHRRKRQIERDKIQTHQCINLRFNSGFWVRWWIFRRYLEE